MLEELPIRIALFASVCIVFLLLTLSSSPAVVGKDYGSRVSLGMAAVSADTLTSPSGQQSAVDPETQKLREPEKERKHQALLIHLAQTQLNGLTQQTVLSLLEHPTIRHSVEFDMYANLTSFRYLMDYLDAAALFIRAFDLGKFFVQPRGPYTFHVDDAEGAKALVQRLYAEPYQRIYLSRGTYESTLLPLLRGTAVLVVDFFPQGENHLHMTFSFYAQIHNPFMGWLIKVVTTLVPGIIDHKIKRAVRVASQLDAAINQDRRRAYHLLTADREIDQQTVAAFQRLILKNNS
jgi:hypothetical protein